DDEHVGLLVHRRLARGLVDRALRAVVLGMRRALRAFGEPALATEVVLLVLEMPAAGVVFGHSAINGDTSGVSGNRTSWPPLGCSPPCASTTTQARPSFPTTS